MLIGVNSKFAHVDGPRNGGNYMDSEGHVIIWRERQHSSIIDEKITIPYYGAKKLDGNLSLYKENDSITLVHSPMKTRI